MALRTPHDPTKPGKMGESEANDEQAGNSSSIEPKAPASRPFEQLNSSPPSQNNSNVRRSSIRPAPASFKPTLRDSAKLPPPMVIHSGDAEKDAPSWGDPELPSYPSHVKVEKPLSSEPFALAEDLHLETLPLDLPKAPGIPTEARDIVAPVHRASVAPPVAPGAPAVAPASPASPMGQGVTPANGSELREPPGQRKKILPAAIAVVFFGLGVAVLVGRGRPSASTVTAETATPNAAALPTATATEAAVRGPAVAAADSVNTGEAQAVARPNASVNAPESAKPKDDSVVPVTVTLIPPDAKLVFRGVAVPGPPFVIDVPKGKKVSMEASRRNYVTRKVTLDSTKSEVTVGLVLDKKHR